VAATSIRSAALSENKLTVSLFVLHTPRGIKPL